MGPIHALDVRDGQGSEELKAQTLDEAKIEAEVLIHQYFEPSNATYWVRWTNIRNEAGREQRHHRSAQGLADFLNVGQGGSVQRQ